MGNGSGRARRASEGRAAGRLRTATGRAAVARANRRRRGNEGIVTALGRGRTSAAARAARRIRRNARRTR